MLRQEFIRQCREKYGDAFEYPCLPEVVKRSVIGIVCKIHGKVEMVARDHLRTKYGCPRCAGELKKVSPEVSNQRWLEAAIGKFSGKFDYSNVVIGPSRKSKVRIACPTHGPFQSSLRSHFFSMAGCPRCGEELNLQNRTKYSTLEDVTIAAREVHGDKYQYCYFNSETKQVSFTCKEHGTSSQDIFTHLRGRGCWECGVVKRTITATEFTKRAHSVHPNGYSYELSELKTVNDKITIHHECGRSYRGRVSNHLSGQGCFSCKSSLGESKIRKFLEINRIDYSEQFKVEDSTYRFDFYLPELEVLVEYDGEQHFRPVEFFGGIDAFQRTRERDEEKNFLAKIKGFKLIRISYRNFDDLEVFLSRAIDRYFPYRVDGVFYRSITTICKVLDLPLSTTEEDLEPYRTFKTLKPAQSETVE